MPQVYLNELIAGAIAGQVVSFPTDTVPALAVLPEHSSLIFRVKQRPLDKPLILMGASSEQLWSYVKGTQAEWQIWQAVAQRHWPGQLTLVLPASERVPAAMNPNDPTTIGIRVPNCSIARSILAQTGALATTSANLSGQPPFISLEAIAAAFPDILVLDTPETSANGLPSTVAKWTGARWEILRQGSIKEISDHG